MMMQTVVQTTAIDRCSYPAVLYLVSIDPLKNRYRFYRMRHQQTLWGEDVLVQTWGRRGTDGRTLVQFLKDGKHGQTEMEKLLRRRLQHGYEIVTTAASPKKPSSGGRAWRNSRTFKSQPKHACAIDPTADETKVGVLESLTHQYQHLS